MCTQSMHLPYLQKEGPEFETSLHCSPSLDGSKLTSSPLDSSMTVTALKCEGEIQITVARIHASSECESFWVNNLLYCLTVAPYQIK